MKIEKQNPDNTVNPGEFRVVMNQGSKEIMRFEPNGNIYIQGRLAESDKAVVEGMRVFLASPSAQMALLYNQIAILSMWVTQEYDAGRTDNVESGRENIRTKCRELAEMGVVVTERPTEVSDDSQEDR